MTNPDSEHNEFEPSAEYTTRLEALIDSIFEDIEPLVIGGDAYKNLPLVGKERVWGARGSLFIANHVTVQVDGGRGPVPSELECIRVGSPDKDGVVALRVYSYHYDLKKGVRVSNDFLFHTQVREMFKDSQALKNYMKSIRVGVDEDIFAATDEYADLLDDLDSFHSATEK
jgi:hypothetical protein